MADANASMNLNEEIHGNRNLSEAEIPEDELGNLTRKPYLSMSPMDKRYPHSDSGSEGDGRERQLPYKHSMAGLMNVQSPEEGGIPPINNLPAPGLPLVLGADASAGAGTSTPIRVPPENAAKKLSRELQNLATTNKPGYGEMGFDSEVPRIKRKKWKVRGSGMKEEQSVAWRLPLVSCPRMP